jgi:hypothetical protein
MTPIHTYFTAEQPTTSLDRIPDEFFRWAHTVHGWTCEKLLKLGQTRYIGGSNAPNALAYFLGNFTASAAFGKCAFCNHSTHGLNYDALANLQCSGCSSAEYRAQRNKLDLIEAEWIAAGCPDALKLDIASGLITSWDSLLSRRKTAARRFHQWTKHAAQAAQSSILPGLPASFPD